MEIREERDVRKGQENRNGMAGMRDKGRKRERRKAREQGRAEGKRKKMSEEAEPRREKILRQIVSCQMHEEDEEDEGNMGDGSDQEQRETEEGIQFREGTDQGEALQEADVEVDTSLRANINVHTPTCGEVDMEKEGESSGQPPTRRVAGEVVEGTGDEESQLISPRGD